MQAGLLCIGLKWPFNGLCAPFGKRRLKTPPAGCFRLRPDGKFIHVKTTNTNSFARAILVAGFVAGLLDIAAAIVSFYLNRGTGPTKMFQYIASAVLGKDAYAGGMGTAALGLLFHFIIAYIFTVIFFVLYPKLNLQMHNMIVVGLIYGILVWLIMNLVVLPLSNAAIARPFKVKGVITGVLILMFFIGLPISILAHRYYARRRIVT